MAQGIEHWTLSSNPNTGKKKMRQEKFRPESEELCQEI
jgi:hypothetical protein